MNDLERLRDEILCLATDRDIYWKVQKEVIQRNSKLLTIRSPFIDMLDRSYAHATVASIRRLTDGRKGTVSLTRVLRELQGQPEKFVRHIGEVAGEKWVMQVNKKEIEQDLKSLQETCEPVKRYADQYVAHHDRVPDPELPKYRDVNKAIDELSRIFKKYYALLAGGDLEPVVSYLEGPLAVFRFAWLPEKE